MIKLNLGCGKCYLEGYINVDLYAEEVDIRDDIEVLEYLKCYLGKVDEIYSAHSLMCVPEGNMLDTLRLWRSMLKEGGKIVIETTDFNLQIQDYNKNPDKVRKVIRSLFGNDKEDGKGLRYQFDYHLLCFWLRRAGFKDMRRIKQPEYSSHNSEFNLCVEAIK